jgi:cytoskeletal protein CcmA (bactofilin family)
MFRRKRAGGASDAVAVVSGGLAQERAEPSVTLPKPYNSQGPVMTNKPPSPMRADIPRRVPEISSPRKPASPGDNEGKKLIVGREISLSGNITACDRLVVEGTVEANLTDAGSIEISETGLFKGSAEVDEAEIGGRFEGGLTVRRKLVIRSTGKVTGTIRYARIVIEQGGEISGTVEVLGSGAA